MIQAYQQTMMRTELERLREENAEQRRLLEQALAALVYHREQTRPIEKTLNAIDAITRHLNG